MNKKYLEKIILIMALGISEALQREVITHEDGRSLLFLPIWDGLLELGIGQEILDIITMGLETVEYKEDGNNTKGADKNQQLKETALDILKSKKETNSIDVFWLTVLLSDLRTNHFKLVKGISYTSLFFPRKHKEDSSKSDYFDLVDFLEHKDMFNIQIALNENKEVTEILFANEELTK